MCRIIPRWWSPATCRPKSIYKMAQEFFGDWPRREKDPFVEFPMVEHPPLQNSAGSIIKQPVTNVLIEIGWQGPSIGKDDAATYAADTFSFIMQQADSRFQRNLVDTGLVNGVGIGYYTQRNVGPDQRHLPDHSGQSQGRPQSRLQRNRAFQR